MSLMLCLFVLFRIAIDLLKTLRQKHTLLTSQHTLSDFRLNLCKICLFQNQNLRTLKPSSISMASSSLTQGTSMQLNTRESLQIKGRSMKLEEWQLTVQVENPVDFLSLARHDCDLSSYLRYQD